MSKTYSKDVDGLVLMIAQLKSLEAAVKKQKDAFVNKYGDGKFTGDVYGLNVTLSQRNVTTWKDVVHRAAVPQEIIDECTHSVSVITVTPATLELASRSEEVVAK